MTSIAIKDLPIASITYEEAVRHSIHSACKAAKDTAMLEQRSPEWFAIRIGCVTASRIGDMMAKTKTGWGASRKNYRTELVYERITGKAWPQRIPTEAMQRGTDLEAEARGEYAKRVKFIDGWTVEKVGFCLHPSIPLSGASPDGIVGNEGLLEIKCPNLATHLDTIERGSVLDYLLQCQWQMACTGRQWVDFCSYDPRWALQPLFIKRIKRDTDKIAELETEVMAFSAEVDEKVRFHKNGGKP